MELITAIVALVAALVGLAAAVLPFLAGRVMKQRSAPTCQVSDTHYSVYSPVTHRTITVTRENPHEAKELTSEELVRIMTLVKESSVFFVDYDSPTPPDRRVRAASELLTLFGKLIPQAHRERYIDEWLAEMDQLKMPRMKLWFVTRTCLRIVPVRLALRRSRHGRNASRSEAKRRDPL